MIKHRPSRRINNQANQPQPASPILIVSTVTAGIFVNLTFDQPVSLNGVPAFSVGTSHVVSALQTAPNVIALTFDSSVTASANINVGFRDPAIRNVSGGYVTSTLHALAA
jgi:hypothetical protein